MIKNRDIMFAAIGLALLAVGLLAGAMFRNRKTSDADEFVYIFEEKDMTVSSAVPVPADFEGNPLVERNVFSSLRGKEPEPPPPPAEPEPAPQESEKTAEPPAPEVKYNMLGSYPNDWPRYKLTGVSCVSGRYTAIIRGGPVRSVTQGMDFARNYAIGDDLSGGVVLHEVKIDERVALLRRGNDVLTIKLGVEPPEVKQ